MIKNELFNVLNNITIKVFGVLAAFYFTFIVASRADDDVSGEFFFYVNVITFFSALLRFGTDTYLKIDCLVVSDKAFARAIPSLEINESEVKGGHGATIGYLDPAQIYYLKSHGISSEDSERLLIDAFLS